MKDQEPVSHATWTTWILEAIHKIRTQKQRPSVERICNAIRQHQNFSSEVIADNLENAVKAGSVLKVFNKGQSSYKDPGGLQSRQLNVSKGTDLSKVIAKVVRELGRRGGSNLKTIEKYIRQSHAVNLASSEVDFRSLLRISAKRAVARGLVIQEGRFFKPVTRPTSASAISSAEKSQKHRQSVSLSKHRRQSDSRAQTPDTPKVSHIACISREIVLCAPEKRWFGTRPALYEV
jgi:histone acetyltransferase MYST4